MRINRENYEEYSIDYLEGNLSGNRLEEMESLLEKFPDIRDEILKLKIVPLKADSVIVFGNKKSLFKPVVGNNSRTGYFAAFLFFVLIGGFGVYFGLKSTNGPEIPEEFHSPTAPLKPDAPVVPKEVQKSDMAVKDSPENVAPEPAEKTETSALNIIARKGEKKENQVVAIPENEMKSNEPIAKSPENAKKEPQINREPSEIVSKEKRVENLQKINEPIPQPLLKERSAELIAHPESDIAIEPKLHESLSEKPENVETVFEDISADLNQEADLVLAILNETEEIESLETEKKKRIRIFPNIKDRLSKENIANALLPDAFTSNNGQ